MNLLELIFDRFKQKNECLNENEKIYLFENLNQLIKNKSLINLINQFDSFRLIESLASLKGILLDLETCPVIKVI